MYNKNDSEASPQKSVSETVKSWLILALILIFVMLYAAAFFGFLKPVSEASTLLRIEPFIFVMLGYFFGRLPAEKSENSLKVEIARQTQKADAAQYAKEKALQERETLEEKIKNAGTVLKTVAVSQESDLQNEAGADSVIKTQIKAALNILYS